MRMSSLFHKINLNQLLLAALLSLGLSLFGYLVLFQSPLLSRREYIFTLLLWIALTPFIYLLLTHFLLPRMNSYTPHARRNWLLLSIGVGILFTLVSRPPQLILLLPKHTLQILIPAGTADRSITLEYATDSLGGDISFSQFSTSGIWERTTLGLTYSGSEPASLSWSGRTGKSVQLIFSDSPNLQELKAGWDGSINPLDTSKSGAGQVTVDFSFPDPRFLEFLSRLLATFTFAFFLLVTTLFLVEVEPRSSMNAPSKKGFWLLYTLPMIAAWVLFLLIFYPGLITQDSLIQWEQVFTGQYTDAHPIFFALLIKVISSVYNSPAAVVLVQILMLCLSLAWGFSELERMGCPRKILWMLSILCAILPVNILGALALRKDIPFSASILALSVIFLKLINTRGEWLRGRGHWLGLGFILGVISLSRINGLPVSLGSLVLILLHYRPVWRRVCAAAGVLALMLLMMYGPVYSALKVKHVSEFGSVLFLHHIAAHLAAGTPLEIDQAKYLKRLAPLDGWNYDCCTANPTAQAIFPGSLQQNYDLPLIKQDVQKPTRIALNLFLKDPMVDIRHMVCTGQIVWNLESSCPDRIVVSLMPIELFINPLDSYRIIPNFMGFKAGSLFPGLIRFANPYMQIFTNGFVHWVNFTPAIYLYLAIYCTSLLAYRRKNLRLILFLVPIVLQSVTLLLINISQAYRYQYGIVLVGLLSIGFLFVPKRNDSSVTSKVVKAND
jgi:hypothetical protein